MLKVKFYDLFHDFIPSVSPATSVFEMISTEKHIHINVLSHKATY